MTRRSVGEKGEERSKGAFGDALCSPVCHPGEVKALPAAEILTKPTFPLPRDFIKHGVFASTRPVRLIKPCNKEERGFQKTTGGRVLCVKKKRERKKKRTANCYREVRRFLPCATLCPQKPPRLVHARRNPRAGRNFASSSALDSYIYAK